jgi:transcriptional regulator with XRE-family HTH domain
MLRFVARGGLPTSPEMKMPKLKNTSPKRDTRVRTIRGSQAASGAAAGSAKQEAVSDVRDLSRYAIGTRLRHARLTRGSRLKDVAVAAGCSESLLSKIENNKIEPSLQILNKLCSALRIELHELFNPQADDAQVVTRAGQRAIVEMDPLRKGHGILLERVIPYAKGHLLQSNIHIIAPGGSSFGLISHEGEEVGYLIAGEVELFVGDKAYRLSAGDTFCFRSELGHGYRNLGDSEARILFVNTPPSF